MEDVVVFDQVSKGYKDFRLDNVSFAVKRGFIHGFIGRNGAGKTTTNKLLMNLVRRDSGTIRVFGLDNIEHEKEIKQRIGFVYADSPFYEDLTLVGPGLQDKRLNQRISVSRCSFRTVALLKSSCLELYTRVSWPVLAMWASRRSVSSCPASSAR